MSTAFSEEERSAALDEYLEIGRFLRHDDQMMWTILGLATTVTFGVWAYAMKDFAIWSLNGFALLTLGAAAFSLGRWMAWRVTVHTRARKPIAIYLEAVLGFAHHTGVASGARGAGINSTLNAVTAVIDLSWLAYLASFIGVHAARLFLRLP